MRRRERQRREARAAAECVDRDRNGDDGDQFDIGVPRPVPASRNARNQVSPIRPGSVRMRWIASMAGAGQRRFGDRVPARDGQRRERGDPARRKTRNRRRRGILAAMARRSAPVHHVPGSPRRRHASFCACFQGGPHPLPPE